MAMTKIGHVFRKQSALKIEVKEYTKYDFILIKSS